MKPDVTTKTPNSAVLTTGFIKDALIGRAKLINQRWEAHRQITGVAVDSRAVEPGHLFIALKGDVQDGHDFINQAVAKGAVAVICEKYPAETPQDGIDIFLVESSLESFRTVAQAWRDVHDPTVVAVAGSVGKTTTKDLLTAILRQKFKNVVSTKGSQNGFIGLPLTLLNIRPDSEIAVVEIGIDAPGAMIQHIELTKPDFAIVTAISEEHLEWLKNLETIAYEENLILVETARAGGTSFLNLDDSWVAPLWQSIGEIGKIGFSLGPQGSQFTLSGQVSPSNQETRQEIIVEGLGQKPFAVTLPLPGDHNARNLLGAIAIALSLGVSRAEIHAGLKDFKPSGGRSQWERLPSGVRVLCDYYNASPASVRAAVSTALDAYKGQGKIWICLADMKELGDDEEKLHRQLAEPLAKLHSLAGNQVRVLLYGAKMKWLFDELNQRPEKISARTLSATDEIAAILQKEVTQDDIVVIKGSRSMRMEQVWEKLRELNGQ